MWNTVLASNQESAMVAMIAIGGGFVVAIVATITHAVQRGFETKQREQTRREVAAYVAEGSMSPDDAARILAAGGSVVDKLKQKIGV